MCGIFGIIASQENSIEPSQLQNLANLLTHRGPDDQGIWLNLSKRVGLAHKRLSIIDLSEYGHQPMSSSTGRYVISYNGEIYNFLELRKELDADYLFKGYSDTEVILGAVEKWGLEAALQKFVGMFAFALWDNESQTLFLVRDRLGIKPIYYGFVKDRFIFSSELRPLIEHPDFDKTISQEGLANYLQFRYLVGEQSIFKQVKRLMPGHILSYSSRNQIAIKPYWSIEETISVGLKNPFQGSEFEAMQELEKLIKSAVSYRLISDVPVGIFLSGGIDSSIIAGVASEVSSNPIKTFSVGFSEREYNEAKQAAKIANYLGAEHTQMYITEKEAMKALEKMPLIYSEPFADDSQIPTYLIAKLAKDKITVALTGDGGDELCAGYNRYLFTAKYWNFLSKSPLFLNNLFSKSIRVIKKSYWDHLFFAINKLLPKAYFPPVMGEKLYKIAGLLQAKGLLDAYQTVIGQQLLSPYLLANSPAFKQEDYLSQYLKEIRTSPVNQQMCWDSKVYLVDDVLTKVDRSTMATSLEARVPLLDHRLFEFAWRLPLAMKIKNGKNKYLLRRLASQYVPASLIDRPKQGFTVPIGDWLRGNLREMAEHYLNVSKLQQEGYLDSKQIKKLWKAHCKGQANYGTLLWTIIMFEAWIASL